MENQSSDAGLSPPAETAPIAAEHAVTSHEARLSRVLDYQVASLAKQDPLKANLGSMNCGLMRVALWLEPTIEQAMQNGPPTVERLEKIRPAIETYLRVTRQVDRFAQLELRAAEARHPKTPDEDPVVAGQLASPPPPVSEELQFDTQTLESCGPFASTVTT